jgi:ABC-type uncharacterized transport system substrate-binding protein
MTPSFWGTTTHHSSKSLAKRARHSAVASERLAGRGARYPIYGADVPDQYRLGGLYAGRILSGTKPADLPVQQPTKLKLTINAKAATAMGLAVPLTLLVAADEVIEQ